MIYLAPGPSQLYFTVQDHLKKAFRDDIPSLSHRSKAFESIFREATDGIRTLLNIPLGHFIVFTSSATEIFERSIQSLVERDSYHLVNGSFSKRYFEIAKQLGKNPAKLEVPAGEGFQNVKVPATELIAVTQNETSTGVSLPLEFIHNLKKENPSSLVCVDAVSSLPYPDFDYSLLDSVFFSIQKGFGLPAGLGVWIVNEACLLKSEQLLSKGINIGSFHSLPQLCANARKNQTPVTPNVLAIYLLAKVVGDFLRTGIHAIRKGTEYKAATLYQVLEKNSAMPPFVKAKESRSKTVIVAHTGDRTEELSSYLHARGFAAGEGHGELKKSQLRFANFPTHSKEQYENLADTLSAFG